MTDDLEHKQNSWTSRAKLAFLAFAGIGAFLLLAEHRAHVLPVFAVTFPGRVPTDAHLDVRLAHQPALRAVSHAELSLHWWRLLAAFASWRVLYHAQRVHHLATAGPYARMRHPQYVGFVLIMFGFLVQWPTLVTLVMFPILVTMYFLLAKREEREAEVEFGQAWRDFAAKTPRFVPQVSKRSASFSH